MGDSHKIMPEQYQYQKQWYKYLYPWSSRTQIYNKPRFSLYKAFQCKWPTLSLFLISLARPRPRQKLPQTVPRQGAFSRLSKGKGKGPYTWYSVSSQWITIEEALRYGTCSQGISQLYLHTHTFIRNRNEPYLSLPAQL